jgi:FkbM family methyltransferase
LRNPLLNLLKKSALAVGGHGLGRIKPLRAAYESLYRFLKPERVEVQGHWMRLDDRDSLELATREVYEPLETDLFRRWIGPGQTVLDIGANIGYYTLIAARQVGPRGRVFAFEPDPANFGLLKRNVEENGYANVVLVPQAVSDRSGRSRLYLNKTNRGDHRLYDSHDGRDWVWVKTAALDRYFLKLDKHVHFIKMDIQGAEAAALRGMKGLLRRNGPVRLVTEFSPGSLRQAGSDPAGFLDLLQKLGFRISEISEKEKTVRPVRTAALLDRPWGGAEDYTNLSCLKK